MIHLTRALVRRWLNTLLHINDTPERTAAAFTLGIFVGFSPLLGFHTILGVALAFVFNLNRVAVLLGVYSNLPWIIAGYYAFTTMMGATITQTRLPPGFRERLVDLFERSLRTTDFWQELGQLLRPLLFPYMVGSLIGCSVIAAVAYPLALAFVRRQRGLAILHSKSPHEHEA